jgi:hypothetical protein
MRDLLKKVGASGTEITAVALNDYKVKIPIADFDKVNVILAYRRDGKAMPVRDKGPLWIMYPFDENPSLKTDLYFARALAAQGDRSPVTAVAEQVQFEAISPLPPRNARRGCGWR